MPAKKKHPDSVVVLRTNTHDLVIRANPTKGAVRQFVKEHHRRYLAGEPGGPSGLPSVRIYEAKRFESEGSYLGGEVPIESIQIADLLKTP